jgi:hypothetical protein
MKRVLLVLFLLFGLGSSFSISRASGSESPFDRYLAGFRTNRPESALTRFAQQCGIDVTKATVRYAQRPANSWVIVKDLSHARDDLETDFYGTVAVWHSSNSVLIERWGMELDTGDYYRVFLCFANGKVRSAETVDWSIPVEGESLKNPAWGYEQRWEVGPDGKYISLSHRFVDLNENPMGEPKLDPEARKGLVWNPKVSTWKDSELPMALLK